MDRKAKIVCTIGPASMKREVLFSLIREGMDVARLNFSHGDYEFHKKAVSLIREGSKKYDKPVAIIQDLQGIKIRVGSLRNGSMTLRKGDEILIRAGSSIGHEKQIFITYSGLYRDTEIGNRILLDDGLMQMKIMKKTNKGLLAKVIEGGVLKERKGVNLPDSRVRATSFTEKDKADLTFGLKIGVDYVAISFVRTADDIRKIKAWIERRRHLPQGIALIAKIEKPEALKNIDDILDEADGIMVARGDLGVEVSPEEIPLLQKMLIHKANMRGRLVITATQMLESMTEHMRPTRAETTDVANAVLDGTDGLMLSGETSSGKYPILAFRMMDNIIRRTEMEKHTTAAYIRGESFSEAIADAASRAAGDIKAKFIAAFTQSGFTAKLVSNFRPRVPIVGLTPYQAVARRMSLYWGVIPKIMKPLKSTDAVFKEVENALIKDRMVKRGDSIVITASAPVIGQGKTNLLKVQRVRS